jgi:capsid protein
MYGSNDSGTEVAAAVDRAYRSLTMVPGMVADDLLPGESIAVIDSKRPNPNVATYVDCQLRRVAGGIGTSFSSLSMNYNGTYSAQRQELVEKYGADVMLGEQFIARVLTVVPRPP